MFAGLPLAEGRLNPALTSTFGVGTMIRHAVENGCREIIIGLGGSCTNDAGTGMACALGVRFINMAGEEFVPTGATLAEIAYIDTTFADRLLKDCKITAMCDIDNPMYGKTGAAHVYAPQKGANEEMVLLLDKNLADLAATINDADVIFTGEGKIDGQSLRGKVDMGVSANCEY